MQDPRDDSKPTAGETSGRPARLDRRRLLLRSGAAAAPILLTLTSQPVAANGLVACAKASSFVSVRTFASRNPSMSSARCTEGGATTDLAFWVAEAKKRPLNQTYQADLTKTVAQFLVASNCWRAADTVVGVLSESMGAHPANPILQRLLAFGLSLKHRANNGAGMAPSYLGEVWLNRSSNGVYKDFGSLSMSDQQLIDWLDAVSGTRAISPNGS